MIETLSRRKLLGGLGLLIAAPAIVRAASLMPVKAFKETHLISWYMRAAGGQWQRFSKAVYLDERGLMSFECAVAGDYRDIQVERIEVWSKPNVEHQRINFFRNTTIEITVS